MKGSGFNIKSHIRSDLRIQLYLIRKSIIKLFSACTSISILLRNILVISNVLIVCCTLKSHLILADARILTELNTVELCQCRRGLTLLILRIYVGIESTIVLILSLSHCILLREWWWLLHESGTRLIIKRYLLPIHWLAAKVPALILWLIVVIVFFMTIMLLLRLLSEHVLSLFELVIVIIILHFIVHSLLQFCLFYLHHLSRRVVFNIFLMVSIFFVIFILLFVPAWRVVPRTLFLNRTPLRFLLLLYFMQLT